MFYRKDDCSVCTAGGSNHSPVVEYMNHALSSLGAITVGGVGVAMKDGEEAFSAAIRDSVELGRKLTRSIRGECSYPEQEEALLQRRDYFRQLILWNKDTWTHEYDWYRQMGWLSPEQ